MTKHCTITTSTIVEMRDFTTNSVFCTMNNGQKEFYNGPDIHFHYNCTISQSLFDFITMLRPMFYNTQQVGQFYNTSL